MSYDCYRPKILWVLVSLFLSVAYLSSIFGWSLQFLIKGWDGQDITNLAATSVFVAVAGYDMN